MITKKRTLKIVAVFLLLNFIFDLALPSLSWALTAGPTAPEYSSFEPVDTTDMVNLVTGDFTYNIPLLEVPGPAGSYPISLSYHAGIQPDLEASWVGLGWGLNVGAINRLVNGYADDHNGVSFVDRIYWEGGDMKAYTVGLSFGVANMATVSAGLTFANDTYRGRGVGGYAGFGLGIGGENSPLFGTASANFNPYGGSSVSLGLGLGIQMAKSESNALTGSVGISYNTAGGVSAGMGVGISHNNKANNNYLNTSMVGASIGSDGKGGVAGGVSVGGGTAGVHNSKDGNISSYSNNLSVEIPVYFGVNIRLGRQYYRYWMDESENVETHGSLYYPRSQVNVDQLDNKAYDTYDLPDIELDYEIIPTLKRYWVVAFRAMIIIVLMPRV
jgi:hypothetical protein